jgi:hypothetical protein
LQVLLTDAADAAVLASTLLDIHPGTYPQLHTPRGLPLEGPLGLHSLLASFPLLPLLPVQQLLILLLQLLVSVFKERIFVTKLLDKPDLLMDHLLVDRDDLLNGLASSAVPY